MRLSLEQEDERADMLLKYANILPSFVEWDRAGLREMVTVHLAVPIAGEYTIEGDLTAVGAWGICLRIEGEGHLAVPWHSVTAIMVH